MSVKKTGQMSFVEALRGASSRCSRGGRTNPVLPLQLQLYHRLIARRRAAVETTFYNLQRRMGLSAIRYIGLTEAKAQVTLAAIAFNMRRWTVLRPA